MAVARVAAGNFVVKGLEAALSAYERLPLP